MSPNSIISQIPRMANKVRIDRGVKYRIVAIAFTKRNNFLGISMNGFRDFMSDGKGRGDHAEMRLIKQFGKKIDKIYILRVGNSLDPLPIHPCANCAKVAAKMGIRIICLHEEIENLENYIRK